jgi:hypothetical protein
MTTDTRCDEGQHDFDIVTLVYGAPPVRTTICLYTLHGVVCNDGWERACPRLASAMRGHTFFFFFEEKGFTGQGHAETNLDKPT